MLRKCFAVNSSVVEGGLDLCVSQERRHTHTHSNNTKQCKF